MNEASVFDSPEVTFPEETIHFGNIFNSQVHNLYGILMVIIA